MVRRGRDEIGKVGGGILANSAAVAAKGASAISPGSSSAGALPTPPPPLSTVPTSNKPRAGDAGDDDDENAIRAFDAALSLCAKEGSEVTVEAVRALFAAAAQRAAKAVDRRDAMEDRCNKVSARNQVTASELASRRTAASRAQSSKLGLEVKCREQAQLNQMMAEHTKTAKAGEEARNAELREKFDAAVPSIQEKLEIEAERRQKQRRDNDELRSKIASFAEQAKLSKEACAAQLVPAALRAEIARAKCKKQEAERRAAEARADSLQHELERAEGSHAKLKADTMQRERSLSKIQNILNERKSMSAALETKTKELQAQRTSTEAECALLREIVKSEEASKSHKKMVDRLQGLCGQLELDVTAKRLGLATLQSGSDFD